MRAVGVMLCQHPVLYWAPWDPAGGRKGRAAWGSPGWESVRGRTVAGTSHHVLGVFTAPSWSQCESGTSRPCPTTGGMVPAGTPAQRWAWQVSAFSRVTHSFTALGLVALCPWHAPICHLQRLVILLPVGWGPRHFCFLLGEVGSRGGETRDLLRAGRGKTMASLWELPKLRHHLLN